MREVSIFDTAVVTQPSAVALASSLAAGPALDALIDERLFDYAWRPIEDGDLVGPTVTDRLCGPERGSDGGTSFFHIRAERHADGRVVVLGGRDYSTDIVDALHALATVGGIATITRVWPTEWRVALGHHTWWAETLPLAICRTLIAATTRVRHG